MTFDQITVFASLARHLNMTKAARELHTTQPNLSKHLRALEGLIREPLFTRHAKGLKLTERGLSLFGDIAPLVGQWQRIHQQYFKGNTVKPPVEKLRIAASFGAASSRLPVPLALFQKMHPDVEFNVCSSSACDLEEMVLADKAELALSPRIPTSLLLTAESYLTSKLVLFVAKDDPRAKSELLTLEQVARLPLIIRSGTSLTVGTAAFLEIIRRQGGEPKVALRCDQLDAMKEAVRQHVGVGVAYYETIEEAIRHGAFKILKVRDLDVEGRLYIVYHKVRPLSSNAEAFLQLLREQRNRKGEEDRSQTSKSEIGGRRSEVSDRQSEIRL